MQPKYKSYTDGRLAIEGGLSGSLASIATGAGMRGVRMAVDNVMNRTEGTAGQTALYGLLGVGLTGLGLYGWVQTYVKLQELAKRQMGEAKQLPPAGTQPDMIELTRVVEFTPAPVAPAPVAPAPTPEAPVATPEQPAADAPAGAVPNPYYRR